MDSLLTPTYLIPIVVLFLILIIIKVKGKKSANKTRIVVVGQRFSGKTQLFITLNQGKRYSSVPSISNNHSQFKLQNKKYDLCDYCGDDLSKDDIIQKIEEVHTIIHVVDGTDLTKLVQVAQFLYRVLVNISYQKHPANYILFFNKKDSDKYQGDAKLIKKIEDEIENIKSARKNSALERQNEEDYLKVNSI